MAVSAAAPGGALGEVAVDVSANLDKLLNGFERASTAADRFDKMLSARVGTSSKNAQRATDALGAAEQRLMRSFDQAGQAAQRYARDVTTAQTRTAAAARQIDNSAASIKRTLMASAASITAAFGVHEIVKLADSYTSFTNRLRSAGLEGDALFQKQEKLYNLAQKYGTQLEGMGTLYGRMAQTQKELGASTSQLDLATEGAAAAIKVYGAGTAEQRGALIQFSQLLGAARVQAQEFNSINDGARPILQAVANGIERFGGSVSKLRSEIINGNLMSKEFFEGFLRGVPQLIEQADKLPLTIGASFTTLNNALGRYIGQTDKAWSATQRVSVAIGTLANNLDTIMPILTAIILAIGAKYTAAVGRKIVATVMAAAADSRAALSATAFATATGRVTVGTNASTISTGRFAGSLTAVTLTATTATATLTRMQVALATSAALAGRVGSALLAAFGGWVGVAIMAVVGSVYLFMRSQQAARAEVENMNRHLARAKEVLEETRPAARNAADEIKGVGANARTAATDMRAFAGATGEAAAQLRALAVERRKEKLQSLQTARDALVTDLEAARARYGRAADSPMVGKVGITPRDQQNMDAALADIRRIESAIAALDKRAGQIKAVPLEAEVPLARTGGRDIPGEIKEYQAQLVKATEANNQIAMRSLLAEIKLRQRIVELMQQGLSLEIASSTAQAEKLGKGPEEGATPKFTSREQAIGVAGRELKGMGLRVEENRQFGGVKSNHPGMGNKAHGLFAIDVNSRAGPGETTDPIELARMEALAKDYQSRGFRVLFNGKVYEAGGKGPGRDIPKGSNQHLDHLHMEAPASIVGKSMGRDGSADVESEMAAAAERAEQERIQNEETFNRELQGLNDRILAARSDQTVDDEALAKLERDKINAERDRENQETENRRKRGQYDATQAKALVEANEQLRSLQLHSLDLKERQRKEADSLRLKEAQHGHEIDTLEAEQEIARTAAARRAVERRILKAQEDYERAVLEAKIASPFTKPIDRQLAELDLKNLGRKYGAKTDQLNQQSGAELRDMDKGLGGGFGVRAVNQDIRDEQAERLQIVKDALAAKVVSEQEAADRIVAINADAAAKIRENELTLQTTRLELAQQTADSLGQIAQVVFGEHSKAARAMFIVSKGFAIAEAALKMQVAIANAMAVPWPANIPAIASAVALGASIISNIASITAQFDTGGWTGDGAAGSPAGVVHAQEYVIKRGPARQHRDLLETINSGRDPTRALKGGGGGGGLGGVSIAVHNHAPGVRHEVEQISPTEIRVIARDVVRKDAPGVIAGDMANPAGKTSKALRAHTKAGRKRG